MLQNHREHACPSGISLSATPLQTQPTSLSPPTGRRAGALVPALYPAAAAGLAALCSTPLLQVACSAGSCSACCAADMHMHASESHRRSQTRTAPFFGVVLARLHLQRDTCA